MKGRPRKEPRNYYEVFIKVKRTLHDIVKAYCKENDIRIKEYYLDLMYDDLLRRKLITEEELHDFLHEGDENEGTI